MADVQQYITGSPFPPEQLWVLHASTADLERGITLPSAWRYAVSHSNIFRLRKNAACVAPRLSPTGIAQAGPRTAGAAPAPASAVADNPDELRARHEKLTRQWNAELQRTAAELHSTRWMCTPRGSPPSSGDRRRHGTQPVLARPPRLVCLALSGCADVGAL